MSHQQADDAPEAGIGPRGRTGGSARFGFDLDAGIINSCRLLVSSFYKPTHSIAWVGHAKPSLNILTHRESTSKTR
jgi:hypothetical protein